LTIIIKIAWDVGVALWKTGNSTISNNTVSNNSLGGIDLSSSSNNTIIYNNVYNNDFGLYSSADDNLIYLNNFIDNTDNVYYFYTGTNIWNSTEEITYTYNGSRYRDYLGNYWHDYEEKYPDAEEIDSTGIWNTPYNIDEDKDNYPLMERFESYIITKRM
jgi:parallel beta-helix repeat protein